MKTMNIVSTCSLSIMGIALIIVVSATCSRYCLVTKRIGRRILISRNTLMDPKLVSELERTISNIDATTIVKSSIFHGYLR